MRRRLLLLLLLLLLLALSLSLSLSSIQYCVENKAIGTMKAGHIFTIEPMINAGTFYDETWPDHWTSATTVSPTAECVRVCACARVCLSLPFFLSPFRWLWLPTHNLCTDRYSSCLPCSLFFLTRTASDQRNLSTRCW